MIEIYRLPISKEEILKTSKEERDIFILSGHLINELAILNKSLLWSINQKGDGAPFANARMAQAFTFLKILAGKINEAWETTRKIYLSNKVSKTYDCHYSEKARESLQVIKSYFSKSNSINMIRNNYGFHYNPSEITSSISNLPDNEDWAIYLSKSQRKQSLFYPRTGCWKRLIATNKWQ